MQIECRGKGSIERAAIARTVFGGSGTQRFENSDDYAQSPIMGHIKNNWCTSGYVYVAYAPRGTGKTTAAFAIMNKPYCDRGLVFSPGDASSSKSYFHYTLDMLGIDAEDPPNGVMASVLNALTNGELNTSHELLKRRLLVLDNIVPHGYNSCDLELLHVIKATIRNRNIRVIVMTRIRDVACRLLSENGLYAVVPLVHSPVLNQFRDRHAQTVKRGKAVDFNWEEHVSAVWEKKEQQKAVETASAQKELFRVFNKQYDKLTKQERIDASPQDMIGRCFEVIGTGSWCTNLTAESRLSEISPKSAGCCRVS